MNITANATIAEGISYPTYALAKRKCLEAGPSSCTGLYNYKCDSKGEFYLCRFGVFTPSTSGSCTSNLGMPAPFDDSRWHLFCFGTRMECF